MPRKQQTQTADERETDAQFTRRKYIATSGIAAVAGLAGCSGSSGTLEAPDVSTEEISTSYSCDPVEREQVADLSQPTLGPDSATVTVDVFEDFACPHCATFATGGFAELKTEYRDNDEVQFRHFDYPIPVSDWSIHVANAARSIQQRSGDEAFFQFSEAAYASIKNYSWQTIADIVADTIGDGETTPCDVVADAANHRYQPVLRANRDTASQRGVSSTPRIFVNGELIDSPGENGWYAPINDVITAEI
jgi:protein-disulfide isomerase